MATMKRKLYAKYNKRSKMIEFVFVDINDDEACYKYEQANIQAEEQNKFYNSEDYTLLSLGVIIMEGETDEIGIVYEYEKDFPVVFDKIKDSCKPKYNQKYFESMKVSKERGEEIINKANGGEE